MRFIDFANEHTTFGPRDKQLNEASEVNGDVLVMPHEQCLDSYRSDRHIIALIKTALKEFDQGKSGATGKLAALDSWQCERPGCDEPTEPGESLCQHCQQEAQDANP